MVAIFSVKNKEIGNILLTKKEPYLEQKERAKPKTIAKAAADFSWGFKRSHHYLQMITLYMGSQRSNATETSVEKHNTDAR